MGVVTSDLVYSVRAGIKTNFDDAYRTAQAAIAYQQIATEIPTTLRTQDYAWLGYGPKMEEYIDRVRAQAVNEFHYALTDKTYKGAMTIERRALEDEQYGMLMMRAKSLGQEAARHLMELVITQLTLGFSTVCYDGQYFYDTDHSEGDSGTQTNTTSGSLTDANLETGRVKMRSLLNDKGLPMGIIPNCLVVGPANERKASDLMGSDVVVIRVGDGTAGSGATSATDFANFHRGKYMLIVTEYLQGTSAYHWHLMDTTRAIRPIILQMRSDVPLTLEDDMSDGQSHIKEEYTVTARRRCVPGYGLWQTAYGSNASS